MFLFVKTSTNKNIIITCGEDVCRMPIHDLKERVSEEWGRPVSEVRIIWAGKEMVSGTIGDYGYTNADHSINAVHRPAVMAGGGQVAAEPYHPPPIELPSDFHTLPEEKKVELLMVLTESREMLRKKPTNSASVSQVAASRQHEPSTTGDRSHRFVWLPEDNEWAEIPT